jgi:hypothetical protein
MVFCCFLKNQWYYSIKNHLFSIVLYLGKNKCLVWLEKPLERWRALAGWVQITQRSVPISFICPSTSLRMTSWIYSFIIYLIGCSLSIAVFSAFNPVCLYFSVVSGCLCPAKCCTTRKSLFLVSKFANTLCLIVVAVSFFLYCF